LQDTDAGDASDEAHVSGCRTETCGSSRDCHCDRIGASGELSSRLASQAKSRTGRVVQCSAGFILCFCFLEAAFAAQPGSAKTAQPSALGAMTQ
jgi:hypothetical protein